MSRITVAIDVPCSSFSRTTSLPSLLLLVKFISTRPACRFRSPVTEKPPPLPE